MNDLFTEFVDRVTNTPPPRTINVRAIRGKRLNRIRHNGLGDIVTSSSPGSTLPQWAAPSLQAAGAGAALTASARAGNVPGEIASAGQLAASGTAIAGALSKNLQAVPIIGGIVAAVAGLLSALGVGQGCGNTCIAAAQQEQVYEAAADNIYAIAKAGMMPGTVAAQLIQQLIPLVQQAEAAQGTKASGKGSSNAVSVIQAEASDAMNLGSNNVTKPFSLQAAQALFIQPGASGWYPQSASAAYSLSTAIAQQYAQALAAASGGAPSGGATSGAAPSTAGSSLTSLLTTSSPSGGTSLSPLAIGAIAVGAVLLLKG